MKKIIYLLVLLTFAFISIAHATHYWTGTVNQLWNNPGNWNEGTVPGAGDDVIILAGTPYACWVSSANQQCNNLFIMLGASLRVYDEELDVYGVLEVYGTLIMDNSNGVIWAHGDVTWYSGSSANISAWAPIKVWGDWEFRSGSNVHLNDGFVEFMGTNPCSIICKSSNSYFNYLVLSYAHDVEFSTTSTAPLIANYGLLVGNNTDFVSNCSQDIIINGAMNISGGDLHFSNGTFIYNGPNSNVTLSNDFFNNLVVNSTGTLNFINTLTINGDLTINGGALETDNVNIYGDWINNAGPAAYNEGTWTVAFKGTAYQKCSSEVFYDLNIDKTNNYLYPEIGATIQVLNDLNVYDGELQMNSNSYLDLDGFVYIWNGAKIDAGGVSGHVIYLSGGALHDYNTTTSGLIPGSSTIEFDYNGSYYNLYTDAPAFNFYNINITGTGNVRFHDNVNVNSSLIISNGGWYHYTNNGYDHTFYGDIFVDQNGVFRDENNIYFAGSSNQTFDITDNLIFIGNLFLTGSKGSDNGAKYLTVHLQSDFHGCVFTADNITINNGSLRVGDHHLKTEGDIIVNSGGRLVLTEGSDVRVGSGKKLSINSGAYFESYGTAEKHAVVTVKGASGYYEFVVKSGGVIAAKNTYFNCMDNNGVNVQSGAEVDLGFPFNYCTFQNGQSGGTLLNLNCIQSFTVANAKFPANTWGSNFNVGRYNTTGNITFSHATGDFAGEAFENDPSGTVFWDYTPTLVSAKVFLEGPFNGSTMDTDINSILPLTQPYSGSPWNYNGTESVPYIPSPSIVDWVLLELRTNDYGGAGATTWKSAIAKHAAFLMNDGTVVEPDGSSDLPFMAAIGASDYVYLVIWHRNHLGVLSALPLTYSGGVYDYDFSTASGQVYGGTSGHKDLGGGVWGMIAGDGNADGIINNDDKNNSWATHAGSTGYFSGDFDMDIQVDNIDKNDIWLPNYGSTSQVP